MNRTRKYTLVTIDELLKKGRYAFDEQLLRTLAFRSLELNGSVFLRASKSDIDAYVDVLAERRKLPPRADGKRYRMVAVMDTGERLRLEQYRSELTQTMPVDFDWDVIADTAQAPPFSKAQTFLPTVIKNSHMFSFKADRFLLPSELLCAHGVPMEDDESRFKEGIPEELVSMCRNVPSRKAMSMVGNSMCLPQVGAVICVAILNAV